MKVEFDGSRIRSAVRTTTTALGALLVWTNSTVRRLLSTTTSWVTTAAQRGLAWTRRAVRWTESVLTGPTSRRIGRTTWRGLAGRRIDVSAAAVLVAPLLALGTGWWAAETLGYLRIERWVAGTWWGTNPQLAVFLGVAALLALATVSAAVNSGLVPTTVLVMGPVFGIALTRYGLTLEYYGTVGISNAVGIGLALAVAFGVPIGCAGFVLGSVVRRIAETLRGGSGGSPVAERV